MEYETIVSEYVDYGKNKFLEVSRKKVLPDEVEFLNISKGYYTPNGQKRYQNAIGFPLDKEIARSLIEKIKMIGQTE
ncbi:MAG: hypothetical protein FJY77_01625 [Candidatus Altiarchaeales archaeon]|nr:hypothetical protein [Candidatus Altiarchaeales archaeon]